MFAVSDHFFIHMDSEEENVRERIIHPGWMPGSSFQREPHERLDLWLTSYQRALRQARRRAAACQPLDWSRYVPLAPGEDLEARDPVEAEVWAKIETEARQRWFERLGLPLDEAIVEDIGMVRRLWIEARQEIKRRRCRRRVRSK